MIFRRPQGRRFALFFGNSSGICLEVLLLDVLCGRKFLCRSDVPNSAVAPSVPCLDGETFVLITSD